MRKFVIIMFLCLFIICRVSAAEKVTDTLSKMENSVLGITYQDQKTETRLSRLEEYVYGSKKSGNNTDRLKHLAKDLNADVIGQEIPPCVDTLAQAEEYKEDSSVDYPAVEEVEKHLSIKPVPNQSLHSRLVAIEKRLFNSVYDTDDFYTRVERIKGKVYKNYVPDTIAECDDDEYEIPEYRADDDAWSDWGIDRLKRNSTRSSGGFGINSRLSKLERRLFHDTFEDEDNSDRLARLEDSVFDTEFYGDSEIERLDRLEGAAKGQKSADRYDSNKFQQGLNTALQIGAMILMVLACIL